MIRKYSFLALAFASTALLNLAGCNRGPSDSPQAAVTEPQPPMKPQETKKDGEHEHKPAAHGGLIVEIGRDNYHAEAVFEKGGTLRLYTLGNDEAKLQEVEAQTLKAFVKPEGTAEALPIEFASQPLPDDAKGRTSQFVAQLPQELWGRKVEVTIPSIRINGERFRLGFASAVEKHEEGMPTKVMDEEEKRLYLTPGGKYTEADVQANGNMTASQKYKGFLSAHDMHPKPGMRICPVTMTKANTKCSWIVGGKTYEFCCPPCIDEFVKLAKEKPEEVKEPDEYVQK